MRDTSLKAYQDMHCKGGAQTQAYKILRSLRKGRNYSLSEIEKMTGIRINAVSGRVNDLKTRGFLREEDRRKCRVTGSEIVPVSRP